MPALPREVYFEVMRSSFRITYKELCDCILSDEPIAGLSPRERGRDAARRNREYIHVGPGIEDPSWKLAPHKEYVKNLHVRLTSIIGKETVNTAIVDALSGSGAEALRASLDACGLDGSIYTNVVNYILDGEQGIFVTACLLLHLFTATAITGQPDKSAQELIDMAHSIENENMVTSTPPLRECDVPEQPAQRLALMRCVGTALYPSRTYPLSTEPEGTEVGSILLSSSCITDVERGVSRNHLHIWRDENGDWWCKGSESLNGTVLINMATQERIVVEPPRDERPSDYEPKAYPIKTTDRLILAENTEFFVVSVNE